jgi:hypothetical protein
MAAEEPSIPNTYITLAKDPYVFGLVRGTNYESVCLTNIVRPRLKKGCGRFQNFLNFKKIQKNSLTVNMKSTPITHVKLLFL